jgi:alpha-glucosidase
MILQRAIYVLRAIGINGIIRTIQYGLWRDKADKKNLRKSNQYNKITPGKLLKTSRIKGGVQLEYEYSQAEVLFLKPNLVRISWEPGRAPIPYTISKSECEDVQLNIDTGSTRTTISSGDIHIELDDEGGFIFMDKAGNVFRRDAPPRLNGDQRQLSTFLAPDEHIYGLGERAGLLNLRPGRYIGWNTDPGGRYSHGKDPLYISTPIYLSVSDTGNYLVYFENSYRSTFQLSDSCEATFSGGMLRYYIDYGSLEQIYSDLAELTGHPYMPPRWALGYHQSRWSYASEAEVRSVIAGFEEHNLPISAIHLDIDYMDGYRIFTIDQQHFANLKQLTDDLDEKGIKMVAIVDPSVKRDPKYQVYAEGLEKDVFCKLQDGNIAYGTSWPGWSAFPDFTQPAARDWWHEQYKGLLDMGISGIWHDMNEPASFAAWGEKTLPLSTMHSMDGQGGNHAEAHNLYGLLMNHAGYEAILHYSPDKRPWILSRSGWLGSQRYAWNWTGDVDTSWEALGQTIPTILGLGLSGHVFSGVDIGGFSGSPSAELYLRWFQLATFLPFFRTHCAIGTRPREPWVYGEPTTSILRKFTKLRYQLMPYIYTLAWEASQSGLPLVRPVFWEHSSDPSLWDIQDEFLFGDAILVAPIIRPNEKIRRVIVPAGRWYSFWYNQYFTGPTRADLPVEDETIPIFIRAGTLLPMELDGQLQLSIYLDPSKPSSAHIYSDSGDGYGAWRLDTFHMQYASTQLIRVHWSSSGDYPIEYSKVQIKIHGGNIKKIIADSVDYPVQYNSAIVPVFQILEIQLNED